MTCILVIVSGVDRVVFTSRDIGNVALLSNLVAQLARVVCLSCFWTKHSTLLMSKTTSLCQLSHTQKTICTEHVSWNGHEWLHLSAHSGLYFIVLRAYIRKLGMNSSSRPVRGLLNVICDPISSVWPASFQCACRTWSLDRLFVYMDKRSHQCRRCNGYRLHFVFVAALWLLQLSEAWYGWTQFHRLPAEMSGSTA